MYIPTFILILLYFNNVFSANILYLSPIASKSHYIWNKALAKGIAEKGHNLTMVALDKPDTDIYHSIVLDGVYETLRKYYKITSSILLSKVDVSQTFNQWCETQCNLIYDTDGLQQLLDYPDDFKFDLIIHDIAAGGCLYVLHEKFDFPLTIAVSPFLLPNYLAFEFGNHLYSTYVPWYGLPYTNKMTFFERLKNLFWNYRDIYSKNYDEFKKSEKKAKDKFGIDKKPWSDITRETTLLFVNIDPHLYYPQPLPPNIIPLGGLHARPSNKLPTDLDKFINQSTNGVIVMSLGTVVRSDLLGETVIRNILKAFSRMPENVLWKFESNIQDVPSNVFIRKWLPQNDVIGHPNIKLFIGHGGAMSTQEGIYHGVPILGIPFVVDQFVHANMLKEKGIGDTIKAGDITEESFYNKIRNIIDNPKYKERAKFLSESFKAQPQTPLERGVFWVEYVLKFGNPTFLETPLRDMPWYQTLYLDIILFVVSAFILTVLIIYYIVNRIFRRAVTKLKVN